MLKVIVDEMMETIKMVAGFIFFLWVLAAGIIISAIGMCLIAQLISP